MPGRPRSADTSRNSGDRCRADSPGRRVIRTARTSEDNRRGGALISKLKLNITMSIDGFVAAPSQSEQESLAVGGMNLHAWLVELAVFRDTHGNGGGEA